MDDDLVRPLDVPGFPPSQERRFERLGTGHVVCATTEIRGRSPSGSSRSAG